MLKLTMKWKTPHALLWGNSIAFSWMWGLGLFFSVQITFMFGWEGLLAFAVPNGLGLVLFGWLAQKIADRSPGRESLWVFFEKWARPFRLIFFLYQVLAITLTVFAMLAYLFEPLHLYPGSLWWLFLALSALVIVAAGCLFGEEFDIGRIKFGHLVQGCVAAVAAGVLVVQLGKAGGGGGVELRPAYVGQPVLFAGFAIPIMIGLLVGPWLDLQQWQRAIQIRREGGSVQRSYLFGGVQFAGMLFLHGGLAAWVLGRTGPRFEPQTGIDGLPYAHHVITQYLKDALPGDAFWAQLAYAFLIGVCVLTTLDSGYIALKWFLADQARKIDHPLLALIPEKIVSSPIPAFVFAAAVSCVAAALGLQLEYFMVFYASFFVGYSGLAIARCFVPNSQNPLPQIRMFSMGCVSVVLFAFGYFRNDATLLILGSVLPLGYVAWLVLNTDLLRVVTEKAEEVIDAASELAPIRALRQTAQALVGQEPHKAEEGVAPAAITAAVGGHFEGKWFVHTFIATYADTNSVGNVYFGMYAMWVGKTRELFFNEVMPSFNLKNTPFYILTRSFEHKFIRETQEFDRVSVKIRVAEYNRKMTTLEHQIFNAAGQLLGKGKQTLIFVSSKDYRLLDIPPEVHLAFAKYT